MIGRSTGDPSAPEPVDDGDAVAEFFAAHRRDIEPADADEVTWARISRSARPRSGRGRTWLGSVGACAAALLAVFAVWSWRQQPIDGGSVRAGELLSAQPTQVPSAAGAAGRGGTAQRPGPVPAGYQLWSLSNAGNGTVYALGSADCSGATCPTLLRSADDGGTWTSVQTFRGTDTSSLTGTDVPAVQPDRAVSEVRFADQQVGYAYGGDLWVTTDRGASFQAANHPGESVLDLEIWAERIYLLTADNCVQGACSGPIHLSTASAAAPTGFTEVTTQRLSRPIEDASLTVSGGREPGNDVVLVQTRGQNRVVLPPYRLVGSRLVTMGGCGATPMVALTISSDTTNRLFGLCRPDSQVPTYTVVTSADAGRTWSGVAHSSVTLPDVGRLSIAATDPKHLVVTAGGPRGSAYPTGSQAERALQVSSDGGRTFTVPKLPASAPASGFDWAASPGGAWFYAVSHTTSGFWASKDNGRTWKVVTPSS